jgi:hypothetical protein
MRELASIGDRRSSPPIASAWPKATGPDAKMLRRAKRTLDPPGTENYRIRR